MQYANDEIIYAIAHHERFEAIHEHIMRGSGMAGKVASDQAMPGGAEPRVQRLFTGHLQSFIGIGDQSFILQISIYRSTHLDTSGDIPSHLDINSRYLLGSNSSSNCSLRSEAMSFSRLWCSIAYLRINRKPFKLETEANAKCIEMHQNAYKCLSVVICCQV